MTTSLKKGFVRNSLKNHHNWREPTNENKQFKETKTCKSNSFSKWVCPKERFSDPPPSINFVHDFSFSEKVLIFIPLGLG